MTPYIAVFKARFSQGLQYRAAALAGALTQVCFGLFIVCALEAFQAAKPAAALDLPKSVSYVWLGQAMLALLPWGPDPALRDVVRLGEVGTQLSKPLDLYWSWFARSLGFRLSGALLRFVPCVVFSMWALPALGLRSLALGPPASAAAALAFALALPGAALVSAAVTTFFPIVYFRGVTSGASAPLLTALVSLSGGLLAPLPLLPVVGTLLAFGPVAQVSDAGFKLWTGATSPGSVIVTIALQAFWLAACALAGKAWLDRRLADVEVVGG